MTELGILSFIVTPILACFAIGAFFALPMIWYHAGHTSRKLDDVIDLLDLIQKQLGGNTEKEPAE
jgi:hypothetical protein